MQKRLLDWYRNHGRHDLPWRLTKDPYAIYISEIMLQQTQVKTVLKRFYHPFLARFPTLRALAKAPEREVMKAWEGLGYYSRARNLQRAAKQANGRLPNNVEALLALPGIGRNTAHAVASFGFGIAVPVMEANVKRVLCRIFGMLQPAETELWHRAEYLLNRDDPFHHNQAMMDVGALVCTPKRPDCPACPFRPECIAARYDPEAYPARKERKPTPVRQMRLLVLEDPQGRIYLPKRNARLLGGLHGFPQVTLETEAFEAVSLKTGKRLGHVRHVYSHFTLAGEVWHVKTKKPANPGDWYGLSEIDALPLSGVDRRALALALDLTR